MNREITITFDGGTTCNIPRLGYGRGYGSFKIEDDIKSFSWMKSRIDHGDNHSNNSAEVLTLVAALEFLKALSFNPDDINILIIGDSQITLNRVFMTEYRHKKRNSEMFIDACDKLKNALLGFKHVKIKWVPRKEMVKLFGH